MTDQSQKEIVFVGTYKFTFDLPFTAEITAEVEVEAEEEYEEEEYDEEEDDEKEDEEEDEEERYEYVQIPGFESVRFFYDLDKLRNFCYDPPFTYAQAVCVTISEDYELSNWSDPCGSFLGGSVLVSQEAVDWILCFPVALKERTRRYALQTDKVSPHGKDLFFCFMSALGAARAGTPVQAVPYLRYLKFLSPSPWDKLAVVRASNWNWDEQENTVSILPQDVLEMEVVTDSEVYVIRG
jgi:hypothetical protein